MAEGSESLILPRHLDGETQIQGKGKGLPTFVQLDEKYVCLICKYILKNPYQTPCGHRCCYTCVTDFLKKNGDPSTCPANESDCEYISLKTKNIGFKDASAAREISNLNVYCTFLDYGCKIKIPWRELQVHVLRCPYGIACKECKAIIPKETLLQHQENECLEREMLCTFQCKAKFLRKNLHLHLQECSNKPVFCIHKTHGCEFSGTPDELSKHESEAMADHMSMTLVAMTKLDLKCATLTDNLEESKSQIAILKHQMSKLEKEKESTNDQSKLFKNMQKLIANQGAKIISLESEKASKTDLSNLSASVVNIQQSQQQMTSKMATLGSTGQNGHGNVTRQHEQQLVVHDVRMAEMDLKFQILETTSYDGTLIWKIKNYQRRKQDAINGRTVSLYSQPFFTDRFGYKLCARVYLNGDGIGKGTHLSLFFVVMKGEYDPLVPWPFQNKVTLTLMDQSGSGRHIFDSFRPDPSSSSYRKPVAEMNVASGCPKFVAIPTLESGSFIKDDTLFIKVVVNSQD